MSETVVPAGTSGHDSLATGRRIGPYGVTAKLGEGGMGEVWRATDSRLEREVAIKVLPAAFVADPDRLARFQREAKLLAQLHHPNIASIFGLEESDGTRALVMELVEGEDLSARIARGAVPVEEAIAIARQMAEALEAAHEREIVHRDLKPANVKVRTDGAVKVLDFGLAKALEAGGASASASPATSPVLAHSPTLSAAHATELGVILGTAAYMSPEQARGGLVDKRTDIWAFGVVLYEMLTGARLFEGDSVVDTLSAVMRQEVDLARLPPATPRALRELLRRCLERNPKGRLRDIGEARIVLEESLRGDGAAHREAALAPPPAAPRRELAVTRVAAAVLGVTALAAVLLWRQAAVPPPLPRFAQLTYLPQFISNARFTADGRTVVSSAARQGNRAELFVRHPDDPQSRILGPADTQLLAVSSTGELAVLTRARFQAHRTYLGTLSRMPLSEASPREMLKDVTAADWSPDGSELAIIRQVEGKSRLEYPIGKVLAESNGYLSDLRISPNGDLLAFMHHAFTRDNRGRVVVIDRAGKPVASSPEYWGEEGLAWSAEGGTVLFSALDVDEGPDYAVRALAVDGTVRKVLTAPTGLIVHDATPDGRLLVSTQNVRMIDVALFPGAAAERYLPWLDHSYLVVMSRDGRSLLFGDSSPLSGHLYSVMFRAADGSPPIRLGDGIGADLSPDGSLVVAIVPDEPPRLMIYPTGAGETRDISAAGFAIYGPAHFVRDGGGVAYCGNEAGKASRCYVRDLATGSVRAVTPEGTRQGRASPDGTAVMAQGGEGLFRLYRVDGGEPVLVPGLDAADEVLGWRADGRSLTVFRPGEVPARVDRLDLATGERTLLRELAPADLTGVTEIGAITFSADEQAHAYTVKRVVGTLYSVEGVRVTGGPS